MAKPNFLALADLTGTGATAAVDISHLESWAVLVGGTFVGTLSIEVSFDSGTTWVAHADMTAKTAPFVVVGGLRTQQVRANCTAYTSGTILTLVSGTDEDVK